MAISHRKYEVARIIIEAGADVNVKNKNGYTPLNLIVNPYNKRDKPIEIIKLLVENGADVNSKEKWGRTVFHSAVLRGWPDIVAYFLANGADTSVTIPHLQNASPLHDATREGYIEIVKSLLNHGADVNVQDDMGYTPLHHALMRKNNIETVKVLLDGGAAYDIPDRIGQTVADLAKRKGNEEILQLLK